MRYSKTFQTTCSYCGVGCGILVKKSGNREISVQGDPQHPVNKGLLCSKGMNLHYSVMDQSDRILYPMLREDRNSPLQRTTWDAALEKAASEFRRIIDEYGPDSVAFYVSGQLLTEEYYIINKLSKGFIGTNNIDSNSRLCMSSAVSAYKMSLGEDSVPINYDDIELADCFLIAGANPSWCHPIIYRRIEARKKADPTVKIIVIDPRKTETCEDADLHLQINPGTDIYLLHSIARILIENNWIDKEFIIYNTEGFEDLKNRVFSMDPDSSAEICGISTEQIRRAARMIGESNGFLSLWAMGLNQSLIGVNKSLALINLNLLRGKIGKPGSGPFSLTGQPNAMGGREVGGMCNLLPAHRDLDDPEHRREVADFWGVSDLPSKPGLSATEIFEKLNEGRLKAIWIVCTNPTVSLPDASTLEKGLANAELVVVQDISMDVGTLPYADIVLPAAGWSEKSGTMTNSDRRITYLPKILDAPGEAKPDAWIIREFARKLGFEKYFSYETEEEIFLEFCRLTRGTRMDISGLDYEILQKERSVQWPFSSDSGAGTDRLFTDRKFYRPNGKAKIHAVDYEDPSEKATEDFPFILTTGRFRDQWHSMTRTGKVRKLKEHRRDANVEMHPEDAAKYNLKEGLLVEVKNSRGIVRTKITLSKALKPGVVFLPMHWGKRNGTDLSRSNNLTDSSFDPISKQPGFKISAVNIVPYKKPREKILIIGGGTATLEFIKSYRPSAPRDEIVVICKEEDPFYNRILLPDYIGGEKTFGQLSAMEKREIDSLDIDTLPKTEIVKVYPEGKKVRDSEGNLYSYDKLILALGSIPIRPDPSFSNRKGVFSLRNKSDADSIREYFQEGKSAIIVGGGLLGLELAAALASMGVNVTVIIRSDRLMSKRLDRIASEILKEEILDRGIDLVFEAEIEAIMGENEVESVLLSNGRSISGDGIIFTIGTTPNIEIAKSAGLKCKEGVLVDSFLQTSDPNIYCIGEMAEHKTGIYGTVAAVTEEAKIAAQNLYGYSFDSFEGYLHGYILKISELDLATISLPDIPLENGSDNFGGLEEITFLDRQSRIYKKIIIRNDKIVAAILVGDKSEYSKFKDWILSGIELGERRKFLLSGGEIMKPTIGKLVCSCIGVGEGNIEKAIREGEHSLAGIGKTTGAGTGCGSCRTEISHILKRMIESPAGRF
ncbi:molybdopterin-dependent oxidoreductase [Leptospira wolffii]|uniref:Molybdopterin-dependent oxidoreductase n=1 Tax=Leptospira wolffii TaxID=409998 RepID=A0ABV5BTI2_9LEPT